MSAILGSICDHPRRAFLIGTSVSVSIFTIRALWNYFKSQKKKLPRFKKTIWKLSDQCEIDVSSFNAVILCLENLLADSEHQRFSSDLTRGKYELLASIVYRLKGICADLQRYVSEDFRKKVTTDDIAKSIWIDKIVSPRANTLSVFSEDSFYSASDNLADDYDPSKEVEFSENVDVLKFDFYCDGLKAVREKKVKYRKSRSELCKCESEQDFGAKLYCLRKSFHQFMNDEHKIKWFIQSGRTLIADLLRHSGREVISFYNAYDRMMEFLLTEKNRSIIIEELKPRKVEELNLWDVLFDFVMLDAFDDFRRPPNSINALVKNSWLGYAMKEAAINNIVWSLIKVKRSRLTIPDGFISRFYDISSILTTPLTLGLLGCGREEFEEICISFKENFFGFIVDIFSFEKVRYTTLDELSEDVEKLLTERIELIKIKLSNELFP